MNSHVIDLYILDEKFRIIAVVDYYLSLSWHPNMLGNGEVEIEIPLTTGYDLEYIANDQVDPKNKDDGKRSIFARNHYIIRTDDEMVGIITYTETRETDTGDVYYIKAEDITKKILNKRIVWKKGVASGTVTSYIKTLIKENFQESSKKERNLITADGQYMLQTDWTGDAGDEKLTLSYDHDAVGDLIETILNNWRYGMRMTLERRYDAKVEDGIIPLLKLKIYRPSNRSSYVIFNKKFDNIINTNFTSEYITGSNVIFVNGAVDKDTGYNRQIEVGTLASGLDRNESYLDKTSLSRNIPWHDFLKQYPPIQNVHDIVKDENIGGTTRKETFKSDSLQTDSGEIAKIEDAWDEDSLATGEIVFPYRKEPYTSVTITHDSNYANEKDPDTSAWIVKRIIRKGDRGDDVAEMQRRLIEKGYSCGNPGADGVYGDLTLAAVVKYQQSLWPDDPTQWDGVCGRGTLGSLGAVVKIDDGVKTTHTYKVDLEHRDDPELEDDAWVVRRVLSRGDRGDDVAEMQRRLIARGHSCGPKADDGIFGPRTEEGAISFQKTVWPDDSSQWDGICGQGTLTALGAVCRGGVYDDTWEVYQVLRQGDRGEDVREMQRRLIERGFSCGSTGADGIFGPRTAEAAIEFQKTVWPDDPSQWDAVCGHGTLAALGAIVKIDDGTASGHEFYGGYLDFVNGKLYSQYNSDGTEKDHVEIIEVKKITLKLSESTNAIYTDIEKTTVRVGYYYKVRKWYYNMKVFKIPLISNTGFGADQLTKLRNIYKDKKWYLKDEEVNNQKITYFCVENCDIAIFDVDIIYDPPEKETPTEVDSNEIIDTDVANEEVRYKTNPTAYVLNTLYEVMLTQEGYKVYLEGTLDTSFSAEIDPNATVKYKEDYILGDYVGIYNNYGIKSDVQVTDVTETIDPSGYHVDVSLSTASSMQNQEVTIFCATDAVDTVYILSDDGNYIIL